MLSSHSIQDHRASLLGRAKNSIGSIGTTIRVAIRILQVIVAITTAGLYGSDLARASRLHERASASFIYAEVVAVLSVLTCALHCAVTLRRIFWAPWDFVMCVLWAALFGVVGTIYLGSAADDQAPVEDCVASTGSLSRMRAAVWIDMIGMLLWGSTFMQAAIWCCSRRRSKGGMEELLGEEQETGTEVVEVKPDVRGGDEKKAQKGDCV